jgi:hypothetical protein
MATLQELIDQARIPLNDDAKTRYSDAEMLTYARSGLRTLLSKRPDLFIGQWTLDIEALDETDDFPLDMRVFDPLADYICARSQFKDDEAAVQVTATGYYALFQEGI